MKLLAVVGEGGVLIAGCPPKEVKIPSRWVPKLGELTARLDDPTALSALRPNFENSAVRRAADKYLESFFMSGTLTWLCIFTGATLPRSRKDGRSAYAHIPTKSDMASLLEKVQLLDLRVVLCGAWLVLHHLKIVSGEGIPPAPSSPAGFVDSLPVVDAALNSLSREALLVIISKERSARKAANARAVTSAGVAKEAEEREKREVGRLQALLTNGRSPVSVPASIPSANASLAADFVAALRSFVHAPNVQKDQSGVLDKKDDLQWACPKEIFLLIVGKWISRGSFTDPHLLAPKHLEWLMEQPRTMKGYKKDCDPFSHFDSRELGPWIDGCAMLESMWSKTPGFDGLSGTFAGLRTFIMANPDMTEVSAIAIVKRLMKDSPDPRVRDWKEMLGSDSKYTALLISLSMGGNGTRKRDRCGRASDYEEDGECEGEDEYEGDGDY